MKKMKNELKKGSMREISGGIVIGIFREAIVPGIFLRAGQKHGFPCGGRISISPVPVPTT